MQLYHVGVRMQKEIEIKIKIDKKTEKKLKDWLNLKAKKLGIINITDVYLNNPKSSFYTISKKGFKEALNFLRIRISNDGDYICFKKRELNKKGTTESVDESESKVIDGKQLVEILNIAGFSDSIEIKKSREVYEYKKFEIVFDKVKTLGNFVEIELKEYSKTSKDGINEIYSLLKTIGINEFIQYDRGYLTMFMNNDHDFKKEVKL